MVAVAALVAQKARSVGYGSHQQVEVSVVVVISYGRAASDIGLGESWTQIGRDVGKALAVLIAQHLIGLMVGLGRIPFGDHIHDVAVGDEKVQIPIVVVVEESGTKTEGAKRSFSQPEPI